MGKTHSQRRRHFIVASTSNLSPHLVLSNSLSFIFNNSRRGIVFILVLAAHSVDLASLRVVQQLIFVVQLLHFIRLLHVVLRVIQPLHVVQLHVQLLFRRLTFLHNYSRMRVSSGGPASIGFTSPLILGTVG